MKKIVILVGLLISFIQGYSQADTYSPFNSTTPPIVHRYAYTNNGLRVDSQVRFIWLRSKGDSSVLGADASGNLYDVTKTDIRRWAGTSTLPPDAEFKVGIDSGPTNLGTTLVLPGSEPFKIRLHVNGLKKPEFNHGDGIYYTKPVGDTTLTTFGFTWHTNDLIAIEFYPPSTLFNYITTDDGTILTDENNNPLIY